jgi:hypothetical protein
MEATEPSSCCYRWSLASQYSPRCIDDVAHDHVIEKFIPSDMEPLTADENSWAFSKVYSDVTLRPETAANFWTDTYSQNSVSQLGSFDSHCNLHLFV